MKSEMKLLIELAVSFLPFILLAVLSNKFNVKKDYRYRQYAMPLVAVLYSIVLLIFFDRVSDFCMDLVTRFASLFDSLKLSLVGDFIRNIYTSWGIYLSLVVFNTAAIFAYIIIKRVLTLIFKRIDVHKNTFIGSIVEIFYDFNEQDNRWYIKNHFGQARSYIKIVYYSGCILSGVMMLISCFLCMKSLIGAPFYPVFAIIIIGEMAFFIDGKSADEQESTYDVQSERSNHIAMYPLLRKPLKAYFGDKLSAEGTTVNSGGMSGGSVEDILVHLEKTGGHIGKNYAAFVRKKMDAGLKPNVDYVRCGYDLSVGKSLLFNTPFYDKLNPYVFYAMNRELLTGGKILVILGRHGTEDDLYRWCEDGMLNVSNIPNIWKIAKLSKEKQDLEDIPDIGIISQSGVHDLDIHRNNLLFLRKVSFVIIVEPSRLVTTAQIGLNLLVKCFDTDRRVTFCSVDRNCDGLVDALSHILMVNITEVSATEYPHGISSYMYWAADGEYLQHRILPGVSRCLGMGIELSAVALRNQVEKAVWYGGDVFPVVDIKWIAKQYYHDLLDYSRLPANQEIFEKCFQTSFNMCNEKVSDYSYITVEDDRNNLFETRRNFATIAEQQGFVNVISTDYMLYDYMAKNTELFTSDAKAIPYITADYARTKRNIILSLSLRLCIDSVQEEQLHRSMMMLRLDEDDPTSVIWNELCTMFNDKEHIDFDKKGNPVLSVKNFEGKMISFEKGSTIAFRREYCIETGKFESVYSIDNADFAHAILDDLQNASYIAEQENSDIYIGTELKGHVYQKYLPGQFLTLNGKYYEMISTTSDDRIMVRRASEHIGGRKVYRQIREYSIHHLEDSDSMGELKTVNNIDIHYQFADFSVKTPGYWKLSAYNDFDNGSLVTINNIPEREYHHKQILKLDFSKFGEEFTDSVRMTVTNLLNETFVTLFAENHPFISAITHGNFEAPVTYSLFLDDGIDSSDKCIFIIEDSQLDIGLLVAVERNISRIFNIISDYLAWNDEMIEESMHSSAHISENKHVENFDAFAESKPKKKKGFFGRIKEWFANIFKKKPKNKIDSSTDKNSEKSDENSRGAEAEALEANDDNRKEENNPCSLSGSEENSFVNDVSVKEEALTPKELKKKAKAERKAERKAIKEAKKKLKKGNKHDLNSDSETKDEVTDDNGQNEELIVTEENGTQTESEVINNE